MVVGRRSRYVLQAQFLQALAHPVRLAVFRALRDGEKCVSEIAEAVSAQRANISRHLTRMVWAGILERRKDGLKVYYRLRSTLPCVDEFLTCAIEAQERTRKEK